MSRSSFVACILVAFSALTSSAVLAVPGEVTNLQWCSGPKNCLQWNSVAGALQYRLYRGEQVSLPCVVNPALDSCGDGQFATTTTGSAVTETPAAGRFFWFLATAVDGSGEGSYGIATVGPRQSEHPGPCTPTCAPAGAACSNGADCCSSSCVTGVCRATCCMAPGGVPCTTGADCCSGLCSASTCQAPCIPPGGSPCAAASQCCGIPNGAPACQGSQCVLGSCNPGFANCNVNLADGCEIQITNNVNHCGGCNLVCPVFPNAANLCVNSQCVMGSCDPDYGNCNGNPADGCEIYLPNNVNHCGACNSVCVVANGAAACVNSQCVIASCNPGFADCNGNPADGCEVNTTSNVSHCGGCNLVCPALPNAASVCLNSQCGMGACSPDYANCNGNPGDGCEIYLPNNVNHCGACGNVCVIANGTAACVNSQCVIGSCNPGFADCNGNPADGCEVNTTSSTGNCGACGNVCGPVANGTPSCSSSACTPACNSGFGNCNGAYGDGCEVNLNTNNSHCGFCGNACGFEAFCVSGSCFIP